MSNTVSANLPEKHIVSFSGGKDSTAMLLRMIEENHPIDETIFCDTGMEFEGLYQHVERLEKTQALLSHV